MSDFEEVASVNEFGSSDRLEVFINDVPALLVRVNNQYLAIEDVCTHDGQPLTDGCVLDGAIECPRHGARFDLKTGKALCMPATKPVRTFEVEVRDNQIFARPTTG